MDNWYYLPNGTVINIWEDEGVNVNFYIVPDHLLERNTWHDDMVPYDEVTL